MIHPTIVASLCGLSLLGGAAVDATARAGRRSPHLDRKVWQKRIKKRYRPSTKGCRLDIRFQGRPLTLPATYTLQIQYGWGHGGTLVFQQWQINKRLVKVEEVEWNGRQRNLSFRKLPRPRCRIPRGSTNRLWRPNRRSQRDTVG